MIDFILVQTFHDKIVCNRTTPQVLPLGDEQIISIFIKNTHGILANIEVIDELPIEFQKRDFSFQFYLSSNEEKKVQYNVRAITRGAYQFGNCNLFVSTLLGLIQHKMIVPAEKTTPVYPSSIQVKKHELLLFNRLHTFQGVKNAKNWT
ncbi:MAG: hypothetical protein R2807_05640 [Chitinophagales bacterium]